MLLQRALARQHPSISPRSAEPSSVHSLHTLVPSLTLVFVETVAQNGSATTVPATTGFSFQKTSVVTAQRTVYVPPCKYSICVSLWHRISPNQIDVLDDLFIAN